MCEIDHNLKHFLLFDFITVSMCLLSFMCLVNKSCVVNSGRGKETDRLMERSQLQ